MDIFRQMFLNKLGVQIVYLRGITLERYFADVSPEECEKSDDTIVLYYVEEGHGRIEERVYVIDEKVRGLLGFSKWAGLRSIGMVMSKRTIGDKRTS